MDKIVTTSVTGFYNNILPRPFEPGKSFLILTFLETVIFIIKI